MNISTKEDANKLIVKDSVDQKGACPKEIKAISKTKNPLYKERIF